MVNHKAIGSAASRKARSGEASRRSRRAISPMTTLAAVVVIAIVLGAGGYLAGSSNASTTTVTSTVTSMSTEMVTSTAESTASMNSFTVYGGGTTQVAERLVVDTANAQGSYTKLGLSPEWLQSSPTSNYLNYPSLTAVANFGIGPMSDALLAQANGVPITIVGAFSGAPATTTFFALNGSSIKSGAGLAGQTVGVVAAGRSGAIWLTGIYYAKRMGINFTMIPEGNATNADKALTTGKTAAMLGGISPIMPEGNIVEVVNPDTVWSLPFAGSAIWATNSMIKSNPTLVKQFVNATLAAVNYLSANPSYASNLYVTDFQGTPSYTLPAATTVGNVNYTPGGTGGNSTLLASVTNAWAFYSLQCTGTCNANMNVANSINATFLPTIAATG